MEKLSAIVIDLKSIERHFASSPNCLRFTVIPV